MKCLDRKRWRLPPNEGERKEEPKDLRLQNILVCLIILGLPLELILSRSLWHDCIIFSVRFRWRFVCVRCFCCVQPCVDFLWCWNVKSWICREEARENMLNRVHLLRFVISVPPSSDHPFLECSCESRTWDRDQNELSWKRTSLDWLHRRRWALPLEEAKRTKDNQERREQTKRTARSYLQLSWRKWRWIINSDGILLCVWSSCDFPELIFLVLCLTTLISSYGIRFQVKYVGCLSLLCRALCWLLVMLKCIARSWNCQNERRREKMMNWASLFECSESKWEENEELKTNLMISRTESWEQCKSAGRTYNKGNPTFGDEIFSIKQKELWRDNANYYHTKSHWHNVRVMKDQFLHELEVQWWKTGKCLHRQDRRRRDTKSFRTAPPVKFPSTVRVENVQVLEQRGRWCIVIFVVTILRHINETT